MVDPFKKPKQLSSPRFDGTSRKKSSIDPKNDPRIRSLAKEDKGLETILDPEKSAPSRLTSWLLSFSFHVSLFILLALILFPPDKSPILVDAQFSEELGDQLDVFTQDEGNINPKEGEQYEMVEQPDVKIEDQVIFEKPLRPDSEIAMQQLLDPSRVEMKDMLSGRMDPGTKNDLIAKYGGNRLTRDAVQLGLRWLVKQQRSDGRWDLKGPYSNGRVEQLPENSIAATALALLAFQGDGNTRSSGDYQKIVQRGWNWLLRQQTREGLFFKESNSYPNDRFYTHAISTIALCELIVLEKYQKQYDKNLRLRAEQAIKYLQDNQNEELGGWRYEPGFESDLSVTGWCLMALQTARMAELDVPETMLKKVSEFLDQVSVLDGSEYVYVPPASERKTTPSMIATGLLCRMYLGWDRNHPSVQRGAERLVSKESLPHYPKKDRPRSEGGSVYNDSTNVYGWYSASMMLKHLGPYHQHWRTWNKALCSEIPTHQTQKGEPEEGSWNPELDEFHFGGGRLYVTCLSILCLEVYYRHLAIFR